MSAHGPVRVQARAWGPGAEQALDGVADLIGLHDDPSGLVPRHRIVAELARRFSDLRLPRTNGVFEALLPAICEQKVTGIEARRAYRSIVVAHGEPAPGPADVRLPPEPRTLAGLPYYAFHPFGLERRRAEVIRRTAVVAARLEDPAPPVAERYRRMEAIPGIGPWTVAEVGRIAFGDPDAVSVGDFHLPNLVAWLLAGEPRADDERMLELLEPYRGQRGRVQRLLEASGQTPPRRGPRYAPRSIERI